MHDVEDYADPVLIVVSNYTLVGVSSIPYDAASLSNAALGRLPERKVDGGWVWRRSITKQQSFYIQILFHDLLLLCFISVTVVIDDLGVDLWLLKSDTIVGGTV